MYTYSHVVWAHKLKDRLGVEHPDEFNMGAVIADMRYIDGTPWGQTHPALDEFWEKAQENGGPTNGQDRDFALGWLLHLVMDDVWPPFSAEIRRRHSLGRLIPPRILKLSTEIATLEEYQLRDIPLTERVPPLALEMGLRAESIRLLREYADDILAEPTIDKAYTFVRNTNLDQRAAIRRLMVLGKVILKTPLRLPLTAPIRRILRDLEPALEHSFLEGLRPFVRVSEAAPHDEEEMADVSAVQALMAAT